MRHPPNTVEKAFELANNVEKQLQVADSFKLDFPTYPSRELNEMSMEEMSGDEQEVNEISRGRKWISNTKSHTHNHYNSNNNHSSGYKQQQQRPQENRPAKQWAPQPKDSKITLMQELDHYIPTEFSGNFFKQFDLAMKLKREELKKQGKSSNQLNEIMESNLIQAFGVTEDQMEKAASLLNRSKFTKKLGNSSA